MSQPFTSINAIPEGGVLRRRDVLELLGFSESTLLRMEKAGEFPRPIRVSERRIGYPASEVRAWLRERLAQAGRNVA
ncbi:MAG TPA: AlpA family phage regulatory protein [Phycisphaerae bacterium]|nr:AlpA family phage regulatory protein [Phycisphaerae bacterium]